MSGKQRTSAKKRGIRLVYTAVQRLSRLLPMEYSPRELAEELEISVYQVRRALPAGCPHRREGNRIWIVGTVFAEWYRSTQTRRRHPMADDEAWCLSCRKPVAMVAPFDVVPRHGRAELVKGRCSICGSQVNRLRSQEMQR